MSETPQERALLAKMPEDQTYCDALMKLSGVHSKSAIAVLLIEERKAGYNDALEAVAKWHEEMAGYHSAAASVYVKHSTGHKIAMEAAVTHDKSATHVRSMKKP